MRFIFAILSALILVIALLFFLGRMTTPDALEKKIDVLVLNENISVEIKNINRGQKVHLEGFPIDVFIPNGLVQETHNIYTSNPSLHFLLPEEDSGGTPAYPSFRIEPLKQENAIADLIFIAKKIFRNPYVSVLTEPSKMYIDGVPALEYAYKAEVIYDFVGGGASRSFITTHQILFKYNNDIYSCSMDIYPEKYDEYKIKIKELCESIVISR